MQFKKIQFCLTLNLFLEYKIGERNTNVSAHQVNILFIKRIELTALWFHYKVLFNSAAIKIKKRVKVKKVKKYGKKGLLSALVLYFDAITPAD